MRIHVKEKEREKERFSNWDPVDFLRQAVQQVSLRPNDGYAKNTILTAFNNILWRVDFLIIPWRLLLETKWIPLISWQM